MADASARRRIMLRRDESLCVRSDVKMRRPRPSDSVFCTQPSLADKKEEPDIVSWEGGQNFSTGVSTVQ